MQKKIYKFYPNHSRIIFHLDMDAFFASIEVALNPALKGKPVIVGGNPESRGVVSTCSYEARVFGVHSAMPMHKAKRLCPQGIFLEGSYSRYREYSDQIMEILQEITSFVEIASIDEAYLDVSDLVTNQEEAASLAKALQRRIFKETKLTCSIGVASNKLLAKIGSDMVKPGGICVIPPDGEKEFLAPLSIRKIPGIGPKTEQTLVSEGVYTISELQAIPLEVIIQRYGAWGYSLHQAAFGRDRRPVEWEPGLPKSVGSETTFNEDKSDRVFLIETLEALVERSWKDLKLQKMYTRGITIKLRDRFFQTITRSTTLISDTQSLKQLQWAAVKLFNDHYLGTPALRLIGVSLRKLSGQAWQPDFWELEG